jgi:hypothetical protein
MKLLSSVAVATIFTLLGRTFQMTATARFSNGGQDVTSHRDVSGEVRLASSDSLGQSVNLAVTHVATAAYHSRAR